MWLSVGLLVGFFISQQLAIVLPVTCGLGLVGMLLILLLRITPTWRRYGLFFIGIGLASSYVSYHAQQRLQDRLSDVHEGLVSRVVVRVHDLASYHDSAIQFDVEVLDSGEVKEGIPRFLRVYWSHRQQFSLYQTEKVASMPEVRPGQVWEMSVQLNRPHTLSNPGGFDIESYLFRHQIRALATVKGRPVLKEAQRHTLHTIIQAWRHDLRQRLQPYWQDKRYGAVLIALVMGDQQGIAQEDWQLFNRSGMTHLVSISGSHITMLSGLATLFSLCFLRLFTGRPFSVAAHYDIRAWSYAVGVVVALLYCLLAGWGIPAQRTFLMLLWVFLIYLWRIRIGLLQIFLGTALIVLVWDPWAILATGFYLSFAAVAVLHILLNRWRQYQYQQSDIRVLSMLKEWCLVQGAITLALAPFLMYFFQQISLISPIVNAYAVISVGLIITPLALLLAFLSLWLDSPIILNTLAELSHTLLYGVMEVTRSLVQLPWASVEMSILPLWVRVLCGVGIILLLLPKGFPYRWLGMVLCVPAFFLADKSLREGEWKTIFLDVGQGSAVLVLTKNHTLLFDTGVRRAPHDESGTRIILPALRALGINRIDTLVVSHSDLDHSGGLAALIQSVDIGKVYASFQVDQFLDKEERLTASTISSVNPLLRYERCGQEEAFNVDGIYFQFLNLPISEWRVQSTNQQSCVLAIEGKYHRLLLTGDIFVEQEEYIRQVSGFTSPYHIVQVPHHGSLSSSGEHFVRATQANYAIAQTAYRNRFQHPHPSVKARWQQQGTQFFNTAETGAVEVLSTLEGLRVKKWREWQRRYWYHP